MIPDGLRGAPGLPWKVAVALWTPAGAMPMRHTRLAPRQAGMGWLCSGAGAPRSAVVGTGLWSCPSVRRLPVWGYNEYVFGFLTRKGRETESGRTDSASGSASGNGSGGSGSGSGNGSETRSGSGGRRNGSASGPSGTRRTVATARRSVRGRSPAPRSPPGRCSTGRPHLSTPTPWRVCWSPVTPGTDRGRPEPLHGT